MVAGRPGRAVAPRGRGRLRRRRRLLLRRSLPPPSRQRRGPAARSSPGPAWPTCSSEMGGDAIAALSQAAGEATFDRTVDLATAMLSETDLHERLRARIEAEVTDDTRVLVAHSLGTVLSYSALAAHDDWPVHTFVTLGSPWPCRCSSTACSRLPSTAGGAWPGSVQRWVNVRAVNDLACETCLVRPLRPEVEELVDRQRAPGPRPRALPQLLGDGRRDRCRARGLRRSRPLW